MRRCPVALLNELDEAYYEAEMVFESVKAGHVEWPNAGGRFEQSALLLDVLDAMAEQMDKPAYR